SPGSSHPQAVDLKASPDDPSPSLQPDYRAFTATTGRSAPVPRITTLPLAVPAAWGSRFRERPQARTCATRRPRSRGDRFPRSAPRLLTGAPRGGLRPPPAGRPRRATRPSAWSFISGTAPPPSDPSSTSILLQRSRHTVVSEPHENNIPARPAASPLVGP